MRKMKSIVAIMVLLSLMFMPACARRTTEGVQPQKWSASFLPEDYFKNNASMLTTEALVDRIWPEPPYAYTQDFSDIRETLEREYTIPIMEKHPMFECAAFYEADGSLYCIRFSWHNQDSLEVYNDLYMIAGYQKMEQVSAYRDRIIYGIDKDGKSVDPPVTITKRDGIQIEAKGGKEQPKTVTFQKDDVWYQIEGAGHEDYANIIMLLDWVWEHPVNLEEFHADSDNSL